MAGSSLGSRSALGRVVGLGIFVFSLHIFQFPYSLYAWGWTGWYLPDWLTGTVEMCKTSNWKELNLNRSNSWITNRIILYPSVCVCVCSDPPHCTPALQSLQERFGLWPFLSDTAGNLGGGAGTSKVTLSCGSVVWLARSLPLIPER